MFGEPSPALKTAIPSSVLLNDYDDAKDTKPRATHHQQDLPPCVEPEFVHENAPAYLITKNNGALVDRDDLQLVVVSQSEVQCHQLEKHIYQNNCNQHVE